MVTFGFARTHGPAGAPLSKEATRPCITTAQRAQRLIRQGILREHIFPRPQVTPGNLTEAPLCHSPRFPLVFFQILLTLSCARVSTMSRLLSCSAMRCSVQRAAPCGGGRTRKHGHLGCNFAIELHGSAPAGLILSDIQDRLCPLALRLLAHVLDGDAGHPKALCDVLIFEAVVGQQ